MHKSTHEKRKRDFQFKGGRPSECGTKKSLNADQRLRNFV